MRERKNKRKSLPDKKQKSTAYLPFLILTFLLGSLLLINSSQISSIHNEYKSAYYNKKYTENGQVHTEVFIEWPFSENLVSSYTLAKGSIFRINYTVLPISFSNVSFEYLPELAHENHTIFSPNPPDFILVPGESYAETFTVVHGTAEDYSLLLYKARPLKEDSNATVHWWFEVLKYGEASVPGVLFSFGILTFLAVVIVLRRKRRKQY